MTKNGLLNSCSIAGIMLTTQVRACLVCLWCGMGLGHPPGKVEVRRSIFRH